MNYFKNELGEILASELTSFGNGYTPATKAEFQSQSDSVAEARDAANAVVASRSGLNAAFNGLDLAIRTRNAQLEMTVNRRLDAGDVEGAVSVLENATLHEDDEALRTQFLTPLQALLPETES